MTTFQAVIVGVVIGIPFAACLAKLKVMRRPRRWWKREIAFVEPDRVVVGPWDVRRGK